MRRALLLGLVVASGIGFLSCVFWGSWFAALGYLVAVVTGSMALGRPEVKHPTHEFRPNNAFPDLCTWCGQRQRQHGRPKS